MLEQRSGKPSLYSSTENRGSSRAIPHFTKQESASPAPREASELRSFTAWHRYHHRSDDYHFRIWIVNSFLGYFGREVATQPLFPQIWRVFQVKY